MMPIYLLNRSQYVIGTEYAKEDGINQRNIARTFSDQTNEEKTYGAQKYPQSQISKPDRSN